MYVDRSELEDRLVDLCKGTKHILIHGESGNGKSWLYKKVFERKKIVYSMVNLANAGRFGSISAALKDKINRSSGDENALEKIVVNKDVGFAPGGVGAKYTDQKIFSIAEKDPLEAFMIALNKSAWGRKSVLVFDNFETILNDQVLISELANMMILLDDDDYSQYNVKICIVGVPSDIREYLTKQKTMQTLANRLAELPEVARLSKSQTKSLLKKGFEKYLKLSVVDSERVYSRILWSTDRIAQYVHELGLECALLARKQDGKLYLDTVDRAEKVWFESSIFAVRQAVDSNMNARETKAGRRNQVIYALGCVTTEDFKYLDIEAIVRKEFEDSTKGVELNIVQRLSELEKSAHPLIKRVPKGDAYRLINPKTKIAIRVMLNKSGDRVEKVPELT